ncbi:uncharacterized protein LOC131307415 isoform X1 [Rhododendron vialii]|uniref:uncharacterized protein LOC131307415 isoform X1 n=1 Tax=Rhododendron vialii TaxID=182163 RepID=UPI00265EA147|nr:uncharacterized protein LOC131307415 isoform X1 [Rhododendron vialii]
MNYEVQNTGGGIFSPFMGANEAEVGRRGRCIIDGSQPTETASVRPMRAARPPKKGRLNPLFDRCYTCEVTSGCVRECSGPADIVALVEMAKVMVQNAREPAAGKESKAMVVLREFQKQNPPVFRGWPEPKLAEYWLSQMERILNSMSITDDQTRVSLAASQLEEDAVQWWRLIDRTLTWQEFRDLFIDKYFPLIFRHALENDFLQLVQRGITVTEYEAEFSELARYAHELVPDEETRIRRFLRGLKVALRRRVSLLDLHSYSEAVNRALAVEEELDNKKSFQREKPQRDPDQRSCFNCGQQGHYKNSCPHNKNGCPQREARHDFPAIVGLRASCYHPVSFSSLRFDSLQSSLIYIAYLPSYVHNCIHNRLGSNFLSTSK